MDRSPITVTVPGSQRKGRARTFNRGAHIAHYTPEKTRAHEGLIRRAALDQLGDKPAVEQPVEFSLRADFAVPGVLVSAQTATGHRGRQKRGQP